MITPDNNMAFFVTEIRKLAAAYQQGEELAKARKEVDRVIAAVSAALGENHYDPAGKWTELLRSVEKFSSSMSDPRWLTVIQHARIRIKSRRQNALRKRSPFPR